METALLIVALFLISLVLLQSGKAQSSAQMITGGSSDLFAVKKERGGTLFISRLTYMVGLLFFILCFIMSI